MSIQVHMTRTKVETVTLTPEESREITKKYLGDIVLKKCYINDAGRLEYWTSWPHGSGTTYDEGEPNDEQKAAWALLQAMKGK